MDFEARVKKLEEKITDLAESVAYMVDLLQAVDQAMDYLMDRYDRLCFELGIPLDNS